MIIQHDRTAWRSRGTVAQRLLRAILSSFVKPTFWQTRVDELGFEIQKLRGSTVTVPWSRIQCLDLGGLVERPELARYVSGLPQRALARVSRRRSFMIMTDHALVRAAYDGAFEKVDYVAVNVVRLADIEQESAALLRDGLGALADEHAVKLDGIWAPDL